MILTNHTLTDKHYISMVAVMLLAHAIPLTIHNGDLSLKENELLFVSSYVQLWKKITYGLLACVLLRVLNIRLSIPIINYIINIWLWIIITIISISIFAILCDTIIYKNRKIDRVAIKELFRTYLQPWKK